MSESSNCQELITLFFEGGFSVFLWHGRIVDCIWDTIKQIAHKSLVQTMVIMVLYDVSALLMWDRKWNRGHFVLIKAVF